MDNTGLEYFNAVHDLSNLTNTRFNVIPFAHTSTPEELVNYERNPLIVEVEKYAIMLDINDYDDDSTKPSKRALENGNHRNAVMRIPESMQKARLAKFLENIDEKGQLPLDILVNITPNKRDCFAVSTIYLPEVKPPLTGAQTIPFVKLQSISLKANFIEIPARHLPMMWLDKYYCVNVLSVRGRQQDLKE